MKLSISSCALLFITLIQILPILSTSIPSSLSENSIDEQLRPKFKNEIMLEGNYTLSYLRRNESSRNARRLSWWLLLWNALHPHLPCPPNCNSNGNCPEHCNSGSSGSGGGSGGDDDDGSGGSGGGDDDDGGGNGGGDDDDGGGNGGGDDDDGGGNGGGDDDAAYGDDYGSSGGGGGANYYSGGEGISGTSETSTQESNASSVNSSKGYLALLCAGVAVAGAIAAVALGQRKGESQKPHPLQGSLGRRMMLFSGLANKNILTSNRPERVVEVADRDNESSVDYVRC